MDYLSAIWNLKDKRTNVDFLDMIWNSKEFLPFSLAMSSDYSGDEK